MAQKCPKMAILKIETPFFEGSNPRKMIKITVLSRVFSMKIGPKWPQEPKGGEREASRT